MSGQRHYLYKSHVLCCDHVIFWHVGTLLHYGVPSLSGQIQVIDFGCSAQRPQRLYQLEIVHKKKTNCFCFFVLSLSFQCTVVHLSVQEEVLGKITPISGAPMICGCFLALVCHSSASAGLFYFRLTKRPKVLGCQLSSSVIGPAFKALRGGGYIPCPCA